MLPKVLVFFSFWDPPKASSPPQPSSFFGLSSVRHPTRPGPGGAGRAALRGGAEGPCELPDLGGRENTHVFVGLRQFPIFGSHHVSTKDPRKARTFDGCGLDRKLMDI